MRLLFHALVLYVAMAMPACAQQPTFEGWLLREGNAFSVGPSTVTVKGTHCREAQMTAITITLSASEGNPVLVITADTNRIRTGLQYFPETWLDVQTGGDRNSAAHITAYTSSDGRAASATLPRLAWIQFSKIDREGPVSFDFEADYGPELGHVKGHIELDHTDPITCVVPGQK